MKTILIPIFDGMVGRNILYTDVIRALKENDVRVVLIPPKGKTDYYKERFSDGEKIVIEGGQFWKHDRLEFITDKLFLHSIPTDFMRIRQVDWYWNKGKYLAYFGASILRALGHMRVWHKIIRMIDGLLPVQPYVAEVFDRWKPDLVFAPTMVARDEIALMRIAHKNGKKTVGMFKSWDNPTSKAFLRFFPDAIIAHTEIVKREAVELYGYPENQIVVTGVPQFDEYAKETFVESREGFFNKLGADQGKKLITFAPAGDWMTLYDKDILKLILGWINDGVLKNCQVLVRLHPAYESKTEELAGMPGLIMERPGKHFDQKDKATMLRSVEFDLDEMKHLASTMRWSDVTINTASTMTIESAIFDTPVVLIGFDGDRKLSYWKSVRRYYDRNHYIPIMKSGGVRLVENKDELLKSLLDYLSNHNLDFKGRHKIADEQGFKKDGSAGKKLGGFLVDSIFSS